MKADKPSAAAKPHTSEPQTTPAANAMACLRPCDMAVVMMAMLLGPGLATPNTYADCAMASEGDRNSEGMGGVMWCCTG